MNLPGLFLLLLMTTTATTTAITIRTMRIMKKQIHRFLRAARADTTALSVYCRLKQGKVRQSCNRVPVN